MKSKVQNILFWILFSGICVVADQAAKTAAVSRLRGHSPMVLIPGVLELLYSENRGAAFGILQGKQVFFFLVAVFVLMVCAYVMLRLPGFDASRYHLLKLCISMITAGAVGNMIDRVSQGYVVDFIYVKIIRFPVFNVADMFVTCATGLLMVLLLFYYKEDELICLSWNKEIENIHRK